MGRFAKWIEGLAGDDLVPEAAARTLTQRLVAVAEAMRWAAEASGEDPEPVHQLRVQARRGTAALEMYWELLRRKPRRFFWRALRDLRRAAGAARDLDVLAAHFLDAAGPDAAALRSDLLVQRQAAQRPLDKLFRRWKNGRRLRRRLPNLLKFRRAARRAVQHTSLQTWAGPQLRPFRDPLLQQSAYHPLDLVNLHELRIRGKQLRYALELFAAAVSPTLRGTLYADIAQMQERLGRIHDQGLARDHLLRWLAQHPPQDRTAASAWLQSECQTLAELRRAFWQWWDVERREAIRHALRLLEQEGLPPADAENRA